MRATNFPSAINAIVYKTPFAKEAFITKSFTISANPVANFNFFNF
jgi:hypothetical protein